MESPAAPDVPLPYEAAPPTVTLNPVQRTLAVYARPARAWDGLRERVQWWFPLVIVAIVGAVIAWVLQDRALLPMLSQTWRDQVADGKLNADQVQHMEQFFRSPGGLAITIGQQLLVLPVIILLTGLMIWFGVAFVLGRPLSYRLALEVAAWSGLIYIPSQIAFAAVAWSRETMRGIHVGFGLLLPDTETPSRWMIWLGGVLDALGPLSIWYVAVMVIGAASLSQTPPRRLVWVLGGLYLAFVMLFAALGAMFQPGAAA